MQITRMGMVVDDISQCFLCYNSIGSSKNPLHTSLNIVKNPICLSNFCKKKNYLLKALNRTNVPYVEKTSRKVLT